MKKVFLGGTCNGSTWRDKLIPSIKIAYFNPVVTDWTPECVAEEIIQRQICDIVLYVITPKMTGIYSVAEVVDDSNKRPSKTVFYFEPIDDDKAFDAHQLKSMKALGTMVESNGATWCKTQEELSQRLHE